MFKLQKLPYSYEDLEPILSKKALEIHHQKHHQAYTDNLNKAIAKNNLETDFSEDSLLKIFSEVSSLPKAVENHGGGYWNHTFFWESMRAPKKNNLPQGEILSIIETSFGSFDIFEKEFKKASATLFGSGWTWVVYSKNEDKIKIIQTQNQQNPLMDMVIKKEGKTFPLLVIDVWEHAYYVDYQNRRPDFINNFFDLINWEKVSQRFLQWNK